MAHTWYVLGPHCIIIINGRIYPSHELSKGDITCFCRVLRCGNECFNRVFNKVQLMRHWCTFVSSGRRAPNIHQRSLTCADSKLSLDSPLSRKGALVSSSLLTCVMIEADGWSMRSVKHVKSQLKKVFRIKIFPLATIELRKKKKKKKNSLQMPPKLFYHLRTFIMRNHMRLNVMSMFS